MSRDLLKLLPGAKRLPDGTYAVRGDVTIPITEDDAVGGCPLISSCAHWTGDMAPVLSYRMFMEGETAPFYRSPLYTVGSAIDRTSQQWRFPPFFRGGLRAELVLNVPEGTVLYLDRLTLDTVSVSPMWEGGPRHNAHLGFCGLAPQNTMPAFELAAQCGFPACIVVPKVTKDGVLVCLHDQTLTRTARDENGNPPEKEIDVSSLTYDELLAWDFGSCKSSAFRGTRIPRLYDFFVLCAKTGMRPMFSTHPALTVGQWQEVKDMLSKLGILGRFHIKSFSLGILKTAYSVFGDGIDGYTWDDGKAEELKHSELAHASCRVGVEHRMDAVTEASVREILDAGFFAAVWNVGRRSSEDYRRVMAYGVTEFTEDHHCSMGLNW